MPALANWSYPPSAGTMAMHAAGKAVEIEEISDSDSFKLI